MAPRGGDGYGVHMRGIFAALLLLVSACVPPPGPMERLTNAAYDLNTATRFGRMDVAVEHVASHAQADFMARHREWGSDVRIVDVDLSGLRMLTPETAQVTLSVSWHNLSSSTIQTSLIAQKWTSTGDGWKMASEIRAGGAPGLFAAPIEDRNAPTEGDGPNALTGQL